LILENEGELAMTAVARAEKQLSPLRRSQRLNNFGRSICFSREKEAARLERERELRGEDKRRASGFTEG
jgi:hypothetical protein